MTTKEKLNLLEETMEVDEGSLSPDMGLDDIDEYDSMTKLSIIVMFEDNFGRKLTVQEIRGFKTVGDILDAME